MTLALASGSPERLAAFGPGFIDVKAAATGEVDYWRLQSDNQVEVLLFGNITSGASSGPHWSRGLDDYNMKMNHPTADHTGPTRKS